ncbi:MAG: hypothetical protein IKS32_07860 [Solobacterium sp.]|nr:hypothetical protein [Solobacterium sp.]
MNDKAMVNDKMKDLADDLVSGVAGGAEETQAHCGERILRDCHGQKSILRDEESNCTFRTRFIR